MSDMMKISLVAIGLSFATFAIMSQLEMVGNITEKVGNKSHFDCTQDLRTLEGIEECAKRLR